MEHNKNETAAKKTTQIKRNTDKKEEVKEKHTLN